MAQDVVDVEHQGAEAASVRLEVVGALAIAVEEAVHEEVREGSLDLEASAEVVAEVHHEEEVEEDTRWKDANHERRWGMDLDRRYGAHTLRRWVICCQSWQQLRLMCDYKSWRELGKRLIRSMPLSSYKPCTILIL